MFVHHSQIRIFHTDAAGVIFYGSLFPIFQEAFEQYLESMGSSASDYINHPQYLMPIVHAEADYKKPLRAGDKISIAVETQSIGTTSATIGFVLRNETMEIAATGRIVVVAIEKKSWTKVPFPDTLKRMFGPNVPSKGAAN